MAAKGRPLGFMSAWLDMGVTSQAKIMIGTLPTTQTFTRAWLQDLLSPQQAVAAISSTKSASPGMAKEMSQQGSLELKLNNSPGLTDVKWAWSLETRTRLGVMDWQGA